MIDDTGMYVQLCLDGGAVYDVTSSEWDSVKDQVLDRDNDNLIMCVDMYGATCGFFSARLSSFRLTSAAIERQFRETHMFDG